MRPIVVLSVLASALVATSVPAQQRHSTQWRTKKDDSRKYASEEASRQFVNYARCVVDRRYDRAREAVLAPYNSREQYNAVNKVVRNDDDPCLLADMEEVRISFQTPVIAGGMAQALVLKDYPDLPSLVGSYTFEPADEAARVAKLTAAEAFGRCVVQRDPRAAVALFATRPATPEERQAINALRDDLGPCLAAGSTLTINEMFVRNVTGVAAYRLGQQIQPRGGNAGGVA